MDTETRQLVIRAAILSASAAMFHWTDTMYDGMRPYGYAVIEGVISACEKLGVSISFEEANAVLHAMKSNNEIRGFLLDSNNNDGDSWSPDED